jgi:hypothetical protein
MRPAIRVSRLVAVACALLVRPASGLDVSFQVDAGTPVTITDDLSGDLNPTPGTIDFDLTATPVDGVFAAKGEIIEGAGPIGSFVTLNPTPPDANATLHNLDTASHTFTVTINSSAFPAIGPPLGWSLIYGGAADDPTPDDVAIPGNSVQLAVTMTDTTTSILASASAPVPLTTPADQPVLISAGASGSDPTSTKDAVASQVVLSFDPGPGDEILVGGGDGISASVFNETDKCIDKMNFDASKIVLRAGQSDAKCVRNAAHVGGSASACIDDPTFTLSTDARLLADFDLRCSPVPAWGVNGNTCSAVPGDCISGAAEHAANALTYDILGPMAVVGSDQVGKCQAAVIKAAGKVLGARWKSFRGCKSKNIQSIGDDTALVATCLGPPQPDLDGKIAKTELQIDKAVTRSCIERGVTPVGPTFPGKCTTAADGAFADCVETQIKCRFCAAVNIADDISPALACDPACCTGQLVGGFCWFLGAPGASCDAVCTGMGMTCNPATETYAGSGGTDANCGSVLAALGVGDPFTGSPPCPAGAGLGCVDLPSVGELRCTPPVTDCAASFVGLARACACQ